MTGLLIRECIDATEKEHTAAGPRAETPGVSGGG